MSSLVFEMKSSFTGCFGRRKQLVPIVHDGEQGFEADLGGARDQPSDHFPSTPIDGGERHAHHLQAEFEGDVEQRRMPGPVLRRGESEGVLRQFEQMRRAVDVALGRFEDGAEPVHVAFGGAQHGRRQGALLRLNVAQGEPARIPTQHQRADVAVDRIVDVFVVLQYGQPHGPQTDPISQIGVVRQQSQKEELGVGVHRYALRMDARSQSGSRARF